ncbi:MAG TPA: TonB-dependent receptor [Gammaproteobacteria bacterium]|jgi:iron complex outermembrane receptor protein
MNSNQISKAVRLALVAGAVSALAAPAAFAADDSTTTTTTTTTNNQSTAQLGKIEVTGTRIKRTDVETAQPVTIITTKEIKAAGLTNVGDLLATLPQLRSFLNSSVNNGNGGSNNVDLRNLGFTRVLVLVNGKRWAGGFNGIVDMNTIPSAIIDHIEILQDGASAIYGSDAIAGVINIITVKNYNGAEANAYMGMYHGDGHTDGKQQSYDFTLGTSGDKSAVLMSVSYNDENGISAADRKISVEPIAGTGVAFGGSSRTPAGRFRYAPTAANNGNTAGLCPDGTTVDLSTGGFCDLTLKNFPAGSSRSNFKDFVFAQDAYNFAPLNWLLTPSENTNLYVQGHYDLADNLTFTSEGLFSQRQSNVQLAQPIMDVGAATNPPAFFDIDKTNPYNPFGVTLAGNSNEPCIAAGSCDELIDLGRRYVEAGPRIVSTTQDTFHYAGGFKGYFNMMGGEWDWDTGYEYNFQSARNSETNVVDLLNLQKSLGPAFNAGTAANPNYECGTAADPISGCVPLNLFGGAGTITPAMVNYTTFKPTDFQVDTARDYTANLTGDLFDLPAGPLGLALGGEYLEQNGGDQPDSLSILGYNAEGSSVPTQGRESTKAEYVEFNIPILADQPFAKDVNLDLAERWSQFKWVGGNQGDPDAGILHDTNASTGRAALKWQTTDSLLLRGSWSQGFRLPNISEFFAGTTDAAVEVQDPCTTPAYAASHSLCGGTHIQPNDQINTSASGNADLNPERSISRSIGFVYNPDWFPGFDFSADYFKVDVEGYVTSLNDATILNECYGAGNQASCGLITVKAKAITNIVDDATNIGSILTEGVDVSTHYKFPSTSVGDFKLGFDMTYNKVFNKTVPNSASPSGYATSNLAGWATQSGSRAFAYWKQKGDLTLNWNYGPWSAMYTLRYMGAIWEACNVVDSAGSKQSTAVLCSNASDFVYNEPNIQGFPAKGVLPVGRNHIGATTYHDVNVTYHIDSLNTDFSVGIRNLFGKNPPISQQAFANSYLPMYDVPGQFFYARIGVKF